MAAPAKSRKDSQSVVDYYYLDGFFVETPPENFSCPICLSPVQRNAFLTQCCGRHFCFLCIYKLVGNKPCPMCKATPLITFPNKERQREINSLQVYCPVRVAQDPSKEEDVAGNSRTSVNPEEGSIVESGTGLSSSDCDWQGELGQVEVHLKGKHGDDERWKNASLQNPVAMRRQDYCIFHLNQGVQGMSLSSPYVGNLNYPTPAMQDLVPVVPRHYCIAFPPAFHQGPADLNQMQPENWRTARHHHGHQHYVTNAEDLSYPYQDSPTAGLIHSRCTRHHSPMYVPPSVVAPEVEQSLYTVLDPSNHYREHVSSPHMAGSATDANRETLHGRRPLGDTDNVSSGVEGVPSASNDSMSSAAYLEQDSRSSHTEIVFEMAQDHLQDTAPESDISLDHCSQPHMVCPYQGHHYCPLTSNQSYHQANPVHYPPPRQHHNHTNYHHIPRQPSPPHHHPPPPHYHLSLSYDHFQHYHHHPPYYLVPQPHHHPPTHGHQLHEHFTPLHHFHPLPSHHHSHPPPSHHQPQPLSSHHQPQPLSSHHQPWPLYSHHHPPPSHCHAHAPSSNSSSAPQPRPS